MAVIAQWSRIDGSLAHILAAATKSDLDVALGMYHALGSADAKRAALLSATEVALPIEGYNLFRAILKTIKASRERRNEYAHYEWAVSDDLPDALLMINPRATLDWRIDFNKKWEDKQFDIQQVDREQIFVCRISDMKFDLGKL